MKNKKYIIFSAIIILLFFVIIICSCIGASKVTYTDVIKILLNKVFNLGIDLSSIPKYAQTIIWTVRFPRVLIGLLVGGALSVSGAAYQGLLKNPMADPYVIGVSSGAAFGATIGITSKITFNILGLSFISIMAFVGAVTVVFLVYNVAKIGKKVPMTTLLLSGIAIGQFLTALTSLLMIFYNRDMYKIIFWTLGSLSGKGWTQFNTILPYVIIGCLIIYYYSRDLDLLLLGEDTANNLGVNVERTKKILLTISAVVTAAVVSVSGIIGFVGLIIPHVVRLFTGPNHKVLLPVTFITGGILMILCDTIARSVLSQEIPVGIITAILGGPFFVYLLRSKKKEVF